MNTPNLGWLFYKGYYRDDPDTGGRVDFLDEKANEHLFKQRNRQMMMHQKPKETPDRYASAEHLHHFLLQTTYPGLVSGTGYTHDTGLLGEIKIGFFFDYTYGIPALTGASIKGVLRSSFPGMYFERAKDAARKKKWGRVQYLLHAAREREAYLTALLQDMGIDATFRQMLPYPSNFLDFSKEVTQGEIDEQLQGEKQLSDKEKQWRQYIWQLENELFEGLYACQEKGKEGQAGKTTLIPMPMYNRDIFHDALLVRSDHPAQKDRNIPSGTILSDDYITPHKNRTDDGYPDFVKNPIPIAFLKVLPKVVFRFQFELKSHIQFKQDQQRLYALPPQGQVERMLSVKDREALFKRLLLQFGVGAKRNVNYGQLVEVG